MLMRMGMPAAARNLAWGMGVVVVTVVVPVAMVVLQRSMGVGMDVLLAGQQGGTGHHER